MNYDSEVIGKKLLTERKKRGWTRAKLSELTNISEKQIYKYEKGKVFPSIESLQLLCNEKIFNCELGYLLCEEEYKEGTKLDTKIVEKLGLTKKSIESIGYITTDKRASSLRQSQCKKRREILNALVSSENIRNLIESMIFLDEKLQERKKIHSYMEDTYGKKISDRVSEIVAGFVDYENEEFVSDLPDADVYCKAIRECKQIPDKLKDNSYAIKVARYELREEFENLVDELYPELRKY